MPVAVVRDRGGGVQLGGKRAEGMLIDNLPRPVSDRDFGGVVRVCRVDAGRAGCDTLRAAPRDEGHNALQSSAPTNSARI